MRKQEHVVDVVIVGGGPAGLAGALCLGRARRSVQVIDEGHPRHAVAEGVHNFLTREGIPPAELRALAWEQMRTYPTVGRSSGMVARLERRDSRWFVEVDNGDIWSAQAVLLATGVIDRHPEIRGYEALWGRSIFHCPYCHGWEVRDQKLAVLGESTALGHLAPLLLAWSADVVVLTNGGTLEPTLEHELEARRIPVRSDPIDELVGADGRLDAIRFTDGSSVRRDALFVASTPRLPELETGLGLELDDLGFVRVDGDGATSAPALWAAGDLTSRRHQVIEAAAQGLRAATAINRQLVFGAAA